MRFLGNYHQLPYIQTKACVKGCFIRDNTTLCYLIKYEKNKQLISRYKYPFLKIFYRKEKKLFVRKTKATSYKLAGAGLVLKQIPEFSYL